MLLALLLLPMMLPVVLLGVGVIDKAMHGGDYHKGIALLIGLACLALALLPFAIGAALRLYDVRE